MSGPNYSEIHAKATFPAAWTLLLYIQYFILILGLEFETD